MSQPMDTECFTTELYDLLRETFEETQGIFLDRGTSLLETLEMISAEQASRPVSPAGATIAAHVDHIRFYLDVLEGCIQRRTFGTVDWQESWQLREVSPAEWQALRTQLRATYQRVLTTMRSLDTWQGEDDIGASLAILAHTACHLGAIRQALHLVK